MSQWKVVVGKPVKETFGVSGYPISQRHLDQIGKDLLQVDEKDGLVKVIIFTSRQLARERAKEAGLFNKYWTFRVVKVVP